MLHKIQYAIFIATDEINWNEKVAPVLLGFSFWKNSKFKDQT